MSLKQLNNSVVDLTQVDSIGKSQLAEFINHFTISYARQLNQLSDAVEQRLFRLYERVAVCKANLMILEHKLDSIPEVAALKTTQQPLPAQLESGPALVDTSNKTDNIPNASSVHESVAGSLMRTAEGSKSGNYEQAIQEEEVNRSEQPEVDDEQQELLRKYRRMISVGVPVQAVENKMRLDGIEPKWLQTK